MTYNININSAELDAILDEVRDAVRTGVENALDNIFCNYGMIEIVKDAINDQMREQLDLGNITDYLEDRDIHINRPNNDDDENHNTGVSSVETVRINVVGTDNSGQQQAVTTDSGTGPIRLNVVVPASNVVNNVPPASDDDDHFDEEEDWDIDFDDEDDDEDEYEYEEDEDEEDEDEGYSDNSSEPIRLSPININNNNGTDVRRTDVQNSNVVQNNSSENVDNIPTIAITGKCPVCGEYNVGTTSCSNCGVVFGRVLRKHFN